MLQRITYILTLIVVLSACGHGESDVRSNRAAHKVRAFAVRVSDLESSERVPGNVHPATETTIESKVSGRILHIFVRDGDKVTQGQNLAILDAHEIQAKLDQALASRKQAEQDLKRFAQLPAGAMPKQERDAAEARAKIAAASVEEAQAMLGYTHIDAPYDGIVTKKIAQEGDLALPGKPLVTLEKQDLYRFETDLPETIGNGIVPGAVLKVSLSGMETEISGTVAEISPTTDPNSRTFHVKMDLKTDPLFRSGQFGYVLVPVRKRPQIRIPLSALSERGQIEGVFVIEKNVALLRLVRTGKREQGSVQILSGLQDGEVIVSEVSQELRDGDLVEVAQ